MLSAYLLLRDKDVVAYVDLRHFSSGSGADEASESVRDCEVVRVFGK